MNGIDYENARAVTDLTLDYAPVIRVMYYALGLGGEVGEVQEKIKKLVRDNDGVSNPEFIKALEKELGDVLWYLVGLANLYNISFDQVMQTNIDKLKDRKDRGVVHGKGDER